MDFENAATVRELIDAGRRSIGVLEADIEGIKFAVIPEGYKVHSLESLQYTDYAEAPHRKKGNVELQDPKSFIEYWNLFHDEDSRIFGGLDHLWIKAVLDYHRVGEKPPRWGQHTVTLRVKPSDEWNIWFGQNGKKREQVDFAEFIEDNTPDIIDPSAATMLEVARTLSAKNNVEFSSGIRLDNGQVKLTYTEEIKGSYGTGDVEVPERFTIRIPVFNGTAPVEIVARLRYRLNGGRIAFWYDLLRPTAILRAGFQKVVEQVEQATKSVVLIS